MDDGTPTSAKRSELARRALLSLTSGERLAYIWNKAGFSNQEIANHLGLTEAAVESLLTEGQRKIRVIMTAGESS